MHEVVRCIDVWFYYGDVFVSFLLYVGACGNVCVCLLVLVISVSFRFQVISFPLMM